MHYAHGKPWITCSDIPSEHAYEVVVEFDRGDVREAMRSAQILIDTCERVHCVIAGSNLVLTAASDEELQRPIAILREAFGPTCRVSSVRVRYRAASDGVRSPVLGVQVRCADRQVDRVVRDLRRRGGEIVESNADHGSGVVRAVVPAELMIGYSRQLAEMTDGRGIHVSWICGYEPLDTWA